MENTTWKSAKQTKKEYAERPFYLRDFYGGKQFKVVENLQVTSLPRVKVLKSQKGNDYEAAALKITDGIFEKDLHMNKTDWQKVSTSLPDSLLTWKGVVLAYNREQVEFVTVDRDDMNENMQPRQEPPPTRPADDYAPSDVTEQFTKKVDMANQVNDMLDKEESECVQLSEAIKVSAAAGTPVTSAIAIKIAERIRPGKALELLVEAKKSGYVSHDEKDIYRGCA